MSENNTTTELLEEPEIVGPGKLLAAAREKSGLSMQQVADKLNFRLSLVENIEQDQFDRSLPATYNRGYLKNYAKLVHISEQEVLERFELISGVEKQDAGIQSVVMQSFSKETEKQAENNRLMWVSYLILAVLVGSTLMWWLQDGKLNVTETNQDISATAALATSNEETKNELINTANEAVDNAAALGNESETQQIDELNTASEDEFQDNNVAETNTAENSTAEKNAEIATSNNASSSITEPAVDPVDVHFTFLGDCWVNIYDATGERIAWGIKKAEYEMSINGQPPFSITLGKPELVSIVYDGVAVDMSQFNRGNIAKFTLPLE